MTSDGSNPFETPAAERPNFEKAPADQPAYGQQPYGQPPYGQPGFGNYYSPNSMGYGYQQAPSTNGFAIAAIILGIIPILAGTLGIIFGFIARSQIKRTGQGGRGLALTGIIGGFCWLGLIVLGIGLLIAFGHDTNCTDSYYNSYSHTYNCGGRSKPSRRTR